MLRRAVHTDLSSMAADLRRISTLQTEFGAFTSLVTIRHPHGQACWNVMREGLSTLEEHLHGGDQVTFTHAVSFFCFCRYHSIFLVALQ